MAWPSVTSIQSDLQAGLPSERVVLVILTDGLENSSREFTKSQVHEMIQQREKEAGYSIVFLGANIDAYEEAGGVGIAASNTQNFAFDGQGVRTAMKSLSRASTSQRSMYYDASMVQKEAMRSDFYGGIKEAEMDYQARGK